MYIFCEFFAPKKVHTHVHAPVAGSSSNHALLIDIYRRQRFLDRSLAIEASVERLEVVRGARKIEPKILPPIAGV